MAGRAKKSASNMIFGFLEQVVTLVLTFVTRTIFIKHLGSSFLGINGLFTNILSFLSIAELGFGTAIIYGMYKPIKDGDKKKIAALMYYYRKIYTILAVVIAILGVSIIPFLKYLINIETEISNITLYYCIFLFDSVCSYLLANRVAIIEASQNSYIIKRYNTVFIILKNIIQIISIIVLKNYLIYLIVQVVITVLTNIYGAIVARKMYPYAFQKEQLEAQEKKKMMENVKSMAVYRFGGAIMNHTDNILISVICGTVKVGLYSNYNMIITAINRFTNIIFNSITASIGNLNAEDDEYKKIKMFYNVEFFSNWIFGLCSVTLFILLNQFISLWVGEKYILDVWTVAAIVINFYILGVLKPNLTYRDTTGLFKETKYIFLITATINLFLSIILGKVIGIFGILIASAIARVLTNFWFEPLTLFKRYFKISPKKYFCNRLKNIFLVILGIIIVLIIVDVITIIVKSKIIIFILSTFITLLIPNIIFYFFYRKDEEYDYFKNCLVKILKKYI